MTSTYINGPEPELRGSIIHREDLSDLGEPYLSKVRDALSASEHPVDG